MHAPAPLKLGVSDLDSSGQRMRAAGLEGPEVDDDRGYRRHGRAFQIDGRDRQRSRDGTQIVGDKKAADIASAERMATTLRASSRSPSGM
jgi:hypothetical protein